MKAKLFVNGFIIYWVFAIIGSNLYIGITAVSFGNLSLIALSAMMFYQKGTIQLTEKQKQLLIPLLLYILLVSFYFVTAFDQMNTRIIAKYFYLMTIPILYVIIMTLGNNYGEYFFRKVYFILKFILLLLAAVVLMELTLHIHMPTFGEGRFFNLPTAFFGNPNGLGTMTVVLFVLFVAFNERYGSRKEYYIFTAITFFLVIVTFSRMSVLTLILFFPLYFILVRHKSVRYIFIIAIVSTIILYTLSTIVTTYVPNRQLDLAGWINNRFLSMIDERTYEKGSAGSFDVRFEIYNYPFVNPAEFITGYGLEGDEEVLKSIIRWSGATNAHSFFIESIYDFGWIGFILILLFFINILIFFARNGSRNEFRFAIIQTGLFILLINVSSSIIGKPIIWAPLFVYLAFLTRKSSSLKITEQDQ